jgi:hypothetical protein
MTVWIVFNNGVVSAVFDNEEGAERYAEKVRTGLANVPGKYKITVEEEKVYQSQDA